MAAGELTMRTPSKILTVVGARATLLRIDRAMPDELDRILIDTISTELFVTHQSGVGNLRREGRGRDPANLERSPETDGAHAPMGWACRVSHSGNSRKSPNRRRRRGITGSTGESPRSDAVRECVVESIICTSPRGPARAGREIDGSRAMMGGQTLTHRPEVHGAKS